MSRFFPMPVAYRWRQKLKKIDGEDVDCARGARCAYLSQKNEKLRCAKYLMGKYMNST